jgi:hypothetical protein
VERNARCSVLDNNDDDGNNNNNKITAIHLKVRDDGTSIHRLRIIVDVMVIIVVF